MIKNPGTWLALVSATTVFYLVLSGGMERTSPGPLATVHERVPELAGSRGCAECHGGFLSNMTDSCLECHAVIDEQLEAGTGLHGTLEASRAENCALCHSDHHGPDFDIVNVQSFAAAGVPDVDAFDHALVGFDMDGRHLELDCAECHTNAHVDVLAEGTARFLGLAQDCATCHEDAHDGEYRISCTSCHGQDSFQELHSTGHERFLPLVGRHGEPACSECHPTEGAYSLAFLGTGKRRAEARACLDCHDSPHASGFLEGVARLDGLTIEGGCDACHDPAEHVDFNDEALESLSPRRHALAGFRLELPHDDLACADCHDAEGGDAFAERFPGRAADDCAACHADPHGGQFDQGPYTERGCLACHDRHRFEPHHFDARDHAKTSMALEGSHRDAECNACHLEEHEALPRTFEGTPTDCEACHADAHLGFFEEVAEAERREAPERTASGLPAHAVDGTTRTDECSQCHRSTTFRDLTVDPFDHALWTGFAVEGAHAQTGCETCHPRSTRPDDLGRTFGRIEEHFGSYTGCETCHTDPHRGHFDAAHLPREVGGREGCARCHDATSFRSFPNGFFHNMWTGFPLVGQHGEIDCSSCHASLTEPDAHGRTWGKAAGSACYDCHAEPHAGQFRLEGLTDCERCHAGAKSWEELSFDHDRDSRFPLEDPHRRLECGACHKPWELASGAEVVRYRPLSRQCIDCHGVHEEQMRARGGSRR